MLVVGVLLILLAVIFAIQDAIMRILTHHVGRGGPLLKPLFRRTRSIVRFGLIIVAVNIAAPLLPVTREALSAIQHSLAASLIVLIGWIVFVAANLFADEYLRKLNWDDADNLNARKAATQVRILKRALGTLIVILTIGSALMTFESVRQFGISIFASAGAAGIIVGLAARPVLANLVAGVQIAITQPIRLDDVLVVEGEWGRVEELTATYVVVKIWDLRRLILPLSYFLERPFQNWTRSSSSIIGSVYFYLDYTAPVERIRQKLHEIIKEEKDWDGEVLSLQVTDAKPEYD